MQNNPPYQLLADSVLVLHVLFVLFVAAGLIFIIVGGVRRWRWVRNPWFRLVHVSTIGIVVAQACLGMVCPLTTLEMWLRQRAGSNVYGGSFIAHWLQALLYYQAPAWVFAACYSLFGLLVAAVWLRYPPRPLRRDR
jgi:hypothetical protein